MKIYTRTGDDGTTGIQGGLRLAKDDLRIAAYGTVDELNAVLGSCRAVGLPETIDAALDSLQHEMFMLGSELSSADLHSPGPLAIGEAEVARVEATIDEFEASLEPLREFILPGGSQAAARLHVARCVCRRAEREMVALSRHSVVRPLAMTYINRVSDLLFVLARAANAAQGVRDVPWKKR